MVRGRGQNGYSGGGGGAEFMDSRREQRDKSTLSIWPPSPKAPTRSSTSPDPKRSKKSRKHRRSPSPSSSSDSEDERRRREKKERKRARKDEKKRKPKDKDRRRSVSAGRYSDEERDRRDRRPRSRSRDRRERRSETRTRSPELRPPSSEVEMEDEWVEAPATSALLAPSASSEVQTNGANNSMPPPPVPAAKVSSTTAADDDSDDDEVGPQPLNQVSTSKKIDERQYGGALLRGEGSAMAAFLQDGTDSRIPRRGEIGLSSDEIATYESVGYVMSGSRHRRMNAVRMRKENQVISAEEKRGILKLQQEERERREAILREEFQSLVDDKLKTQGK
ncbi:hypothetical protein EIP91_011595 [Steccherinum ochraceum]|uniref:NF-kappa-B-activating protein C-terminal domain-containing protein n=1 Tax=Steccherinum ochraceum TaxID=92696 RepID=A0A4R0RI55_9APHY|nr:hypothetical protein EIP91_011595 [Steccherinum ochraceum]